MTKLWAEMRRKVPDLHGQGSWIFSTLSDFAFSNTHPRDITSYFVPPSVSLPTVLCGPDATDVLILDSWILMRWSWWCKVVPLGYSVLYSHLLS